eukprot:TRINITY_DN44822_c0_g1_i1.p1 TRINITY_DN44822_c0_g1~~TRINITY_DN44822_c0_g1_i1.p1  ORF type:complete len:214 (+),score=61.74 TRINITY_DN44822_c0_g1_i1:66-707(+)
MPEQAERDARGLWSKSVYEKMPPIPVLYSLMTAVYALIGQGVAHFAWGRANSKAGERLAFLADHDLGWLHVSIVLLRMCFFSLQINAGVHRRESKVKVPDQHVYSTYGADEKTGYVFLESEGALGRFNRAQRSVFNLMEVLPFAVGYSVLGGYLFPFPTFVCALTFSVSRWFSARGYTASAEGRLPGFLVGQISFHVMENLTLFAGLKALSVL